MRKTLNSPGEKIVKDIKRATRKHYSSEEKIRIVLDGLAAWNPTASCRCYGLCQRHQKTHRCRLREGERPKPY